MNGSSSLLLQGFLLVTLLLVRYVLPVIAHDDDDKVDLPPILDSDDISYFFEHESVEKLHGVLSSVFARSQRNNSNSRVLESLLLPAQLTSRGGGSSYTTAYKLQMDLEQASYLSEHLEDKDLARFFAKNVIPVYQSVLERIPPLHELERTQGLYAFRKIDYESGIGEIYNQALYHTDFDTLRDKQGKPQSLLNPKLDINAITQQWEGRTSNNSPPGIVVIDDLLTQPALQRIRQLLLESTVFFQTKMPLKFGGYAGAYIDDGLHDKILLYLAKELAQTLPMITPHALKYLWAYKYDCNYQGIHLHADQAAINVNVWITPDEANLDSRSGGLVVFTAKPPAEWEFKDYNTNTDFVVEQLLRPTNFANVTIPHKQNRAVLFDSALFHQTDAFRFKAGYENRRINLTILYGDMQKAKGNHNMEDEL